MALLRAFENDTEREAFAVEAGTTVNYLYALAGCHRGQPRAGLAVGIEDASYRWNNVTRGRMPIVSGARDRHHVRAGWPHRRLLMIVTA
jgi:hypothetical protein